jgi:Flp pilus assembly protein TadD
LRLPAKAQRLRLAVWARSQARMRERYGFDLAALDMLERIRSLVSEHPDDPERVLLLAAALAMSGDDDLAVIQARRAVELAPGSARAQTTLASLLLRGGDQPAALDCARRAAELDGADPSVLYNLGLAEWFAGDRKQARTAFDSAAAALSAPPGGPAVNGHPDEDSQRGSWWSLRRRV